MQEIVARIDLFALYYDEKLTLTSFASISTGKDWEEYFKRVTADQKYIDETNIDREACKHASIRFKEFLIGTRGAWWTPYCALISTADAVLEDQRGGYRAFFVFGDRLRVMYGIPSEAGFGRQLLGTRLTQMYGIPGSLHRHLIIKNKKNVWHSVRAECGAKAHT